MPAMASESMRYRKPEPEFPEVPTAGTMPFDFLPRVLRAAAVISPRAPYWDWAAACPSRHPMATPGTWADMAFLIPGYPEEADLDTYVDVHHRYAFVEMLSHVTDVVDHWPSDRTSAMFRAWFGVRFVHCVRDLAGEPLRVASVD
jgi:hypothetical protein